MKRSSPEVNVSLCPASCDSLTEKCDTVLVPFSTFSHRQKRVETVPPACESPIQMRVAQE
eukprot:1174318-Rhodomonas_salina.1